MRGPRVDITGLGVSQAILYVIAILALIFAILAYTRPLPTDQDTAFPLYDSGTQTLDGTGVWTDIHFHHYIRLDGSDHHRHNPHHPHSNRVEEEEEQHHENHQWHHEHGSAKVRSKVDGVFEVYLSVQAGLVNPPQMEPTPEVFRKRLVDEMHQTESPTAEALPPACNSTLYYIRAVRQSHERESHESHERAPFFEVPGSFTWITHTVFLSKTFAVRVRKGEVFKFQWMSPCPYLVLTPVPLDNLPIGPLHHNDEDRPTNGTYPSSATLVISSM